MRGGEERWEVRHLVRGERRGDVRGGDGGTVTAELARYRSGVSGVVARQERVRDGEGSACVDVHRAAIVGEEAQDRAVSERE